MVISGPEVDYEDVESAFDEAQVDVDDFIIYDDIDFDGWEEITDWDEICEFFFEKQNEPDVIIDDEEDIEDDNIPPYDEDDNLEECETNIGECQIPSYESVRIDSNLKRCNEKKRDCCPKKKSVNENKIPYKDKSAKKSNNKRIVPLSEALSGKITKRNEPTDVNYIIDAMIGKRNSKSIVESALNKARKEAKAKKLNENFEYLRGKVNEKVFNSIISAIKNGKKTIHENVRIAGKNMVDYSLDDLQKIYEKVCAQVENMKKQTTDGLNEADAANFNDKLARKERLCAILYEEIEFRSALKEAEDDFQMDFANLNPNAEDNNDSENNDKSEDSEKSDDDDKDPDKDEEVEIGSIVVTLVNKDAADELKSDLVDEGIPEDCIEIVSSKEDEETEDENEESEDEESGNEENAESEENKEEKTEESVKTSGKKSLNEDDEDADSDENAEGDNAEENSEDEKSEEDEEEESYKVILTNTDYAESLKTVLVDKWGMSEEEFTEMIGGEFVEEDDKEESSSEDSESSDDNEEKKDDSDEEDVDDFDPSKVFNDI